MHPLDADLTIRQKSVIHAQAAALLSAETPYAALLALLPILADLGASALPKGAIEGFAMQLVPEPLRSQLEPIFAATRAKPADPNIS